MKLVNFEDACQQTPSFFHSLSQFFDGKEEGGHAVARSEERGLDEGEQHVAKLECCGEEEDVGKLQWPEDEEEDYAGAHFLTLAAAWPWG